MIQKAADETVRAGGTRAWRVLMETQMDEPTFILIFQNLFERAKSDTTAALIVRDTLIGKPRIAPVEVQPLQLPDMDTTQGCVTALATLVAAQNDGRVTEQVAAELRATIVVTLQAHRQLDAERGLEILEQAGAIPRYQTPDEAAAFARWFQEGGEG